MSNGQSDNIFQPARFFASAGILNIQTLTPRFEDGKHTNISASFKTGSWGLVNPSLLLEQRISRKWTVSANGEWMSSDGHYPYTLYYGNEEGDLSSREKRKNTDVQTFRAEAGLYGNFSDKEQWRLKAYYFQSSRGLPNATTFYYTHSSQRLWDKNTFIQSQYKKEFNRQWVFQTSAKWNWSYQRYLDPDYKGSTGEIENSYYQQEYYLSGSVLYRLLNNLSFSFSSDGSINTMNANLNDFAHPTRYSWLTAFAGKYVNNWLTLSASALATVIYEQADKGGSAGNHRKLSPYVSASFKPFDKEEFRIRIFYKDIFRLPSFNDLYYGETGNNKLKPENARQYNIGLTYSKDVCPFLPYLSATVDAYYNKITDKIIAYPTKNLAVWSMRNLGSVEIKGIDVTGSVSLQPCEKLRINLSGNYTYQQALDVTNPDPASEEGRTYKHQIAYTPRVSGSGQVGIETSWVNLSYSFLFSGKRYTQGEKIKMGMTTLCYIEKDNKYLMLHRIKKEHDINKDKWIGVGGHFEHGESPEDCMFREVMEETGLTPTKYRFCGIVTFLSDMGTDKEAWEYMCLYHIEEFKGKIKECDEGVLEWVEKEKILDLDLWEGDRLFLRYMQERIPFFSLKLVYEEGNLTAAVLDGKPLEFFDILDEKGNKTGRIKERSLVHEDGDIHGTVHIWIRRKTGKGYDLLLQKRSKQKDSFPGCYDISSAGHISAGDEPLETALRELEEELGIKAEPEQLKKICMHEGSMNGNFYGREFKNHEISTVYMYEETVDIRKLKLQKEEVEEVMWMNQEELIQKVKDGEIPNCIYLDEVEKI